MDVLLIGSTGNLMRKMVEKLHKEGHRIFVLTEEGKETFFNRRVFETYRFSYDNACIREVFVSVKPQVTLFLGAFDKEFSWKTGMNTSIKYASSLLNLLMSFAALRQGRFIYLSSEEALEGFQVADDGEIERTKNCSEKAQAIAMGEKTCLDYGKMTMGDVLVLRLGNLYGIPEDAEELENVAARICMDAMDLGEIKLHPGSSIQVRSAVPVMDLTEEDMEVLEGEKSYYLLHMQDAIEFIYKIMTVDHHRQSMYQITGKTLISQRQMAELISDGMAGADAELVRPAIMEGIVDSETNVNLDASDADAEFQLFEMNPPQKALPILAEYIKKHAGRFSRRTDRQESAWDAFVRKTKEMIRAAVPFIENLILFIPFFMLNNRATDHAYFKNLDFYLLYVLLFAIVHGQQQAIFSSLLAIAGYVFRQMYDRSGFDVLLDYSTYVWMAQLLILGLVVGYMKDKLRAIREENTHEVNFLSRQLADMSDINGSNVRVKDVLSDQLVNQNDSIGKIYEITSSLDQYEPEEVLFYAADVIAKIMHCKDVAIYSTADDTYARLVSSTSDKARSLGNSVHYKKMEQMYEVLAQKKVYVNKNMTEEYPLMANAIFGGDEMQIIIMVWGISWERMTLGQANVLAISSYLTQNALLRADKYMEVLRSQRYVGNTHVMEAEAYAQLVSAFVRAREKGFTKCTLIDLNTNGASLEEVDARLSQLLRTTDYVGCTKDGTIQVLLANSGPADAQFAMKRLVDGGFECQIEEETAS
ncbi:MAG: NAD(P)-dependent oxidoreductase [Lachnospiraceae bacterium]|nr:NAD(P)-dependent oxidoreductase [Lachnospiraceae bacterium]MBO7340212.1 NAD(P)-dependent oxidoreductase [Lachnospiraceae bacterium]MBP5264360.1 NAD(P)-dependent oxidoreductase [Lachnospiraceae bacterium]